MNRFYPILIFFSIILINSSCTHRYYVPTDAMLLTVERAGDLNISAGVGLTQNTHYSILAGYSPIKHIGLAANFFQDLGSFKKKSESHNLTAEGAIGVYYPNHSRSSDKVIRTSVDVYAGYGFGQHQKIRAERGVLQLNFKKRFIQTDLHINKKNGLSFRTGFKVVQINYTRGIISGDISPGDFSFLEEIKGHRTFMALEWGSRLEFGKNPLKIFISTTVTNITEVLVEEVYSFQPIVWQVGLSSTF